MSAVTPFQTTRYRCPHCRRTGSSRIRMQEHADACAHDPGTRACPTCSADGFARLEGAAAERTCANGARDYTATLRLNCPAWQARTEIEPS